MKQEGPVTVAGLGRSELENLLSRLLVQTGSSLGALIEQKQSAATDDDTPSWLVGAARHLEDLKQNSVLPTGGHTTQLSLVKSPQGGRLGLRLQHFEGVVIVLVVQPDSPAATAGLRVGDRLLEVAGAEVTSGDQVATLLGDAAGAVAISVLRLEPPEPPTEEAEEPTASPAAQLAQAELHKLEEWAQEQTATRIEKQQEQEEEAAQEEAALARARAVWQSLDVSAREQLSALPIPAARALLVRTSTCSTSSLSNNQI